MTLRAAISAAAAAALALVGLGSSVSASATSVTPEIAQNWRRAEAFYRHGQFIDSFRSLAPLLDTGRAFDDPVARINFLSDAAAISCMAGEAGWATALASQGDQALLSLPLEQRQAIPDVSSLVGLVLTEMPDDFRFSTDSDYYMADGTLVDSNHNGVVDDGPYRDIDGSHVGGDPNLWRFPGVISGPGVYDHGCTDQGVALVGRYTHVAITSGMRTLPIKVHCNYAVPCSGLRAQLLDDLYSDSSPLAVRSFGLAPGQTRVVNLRLPAWLRKELATLKRVRNDRGQIVVTGNRHLLNVGIKLSRAGHLS